MTEENDQIDIETIAAKLPLTVSEDDIEACRSVAATLEATAEGFYDSPQQTTIASKQSDDVYNSLLAIYVDTQETTNDCSGTDSDTLSGCSVAVKDNIAVYGLPMTCGLESFSFTPAYDAVAIDRLREAGARIVGKANMDTLAFGPSGEFSEISSVINPIDADRVPGGSSSGSGAAVAAGIVDIGLGTDTGGSVRIPAACCGVVGAKPTHGLVPRHGLVGFAPSIDTIGPLTRNVDTAAHALDAMAGFSRRDPTSRRIQGSLLPNGKHREQLQIGLLEPSFERSTTTVTNAVHEIATNAADRGEIDLMSVDLDMEAIEDAYYLIGATEFAWLIRQNGIIRGQGTGYEEGFRHAFEEFLSSTTLNSHISRRVLPSAFLDMKLNGKPYVVARQEVRRFRTKLAKIFEDVDLLLSPTIRTLPPKRGAINATEGMEDLLGNTAPFNLAGVPAVSIPITITEGLPISAQIIGPLFGDQQTLEGARIIEKIADTESH